MSGAVTLSLKSALRTGSGLVTGVVQRSIVDRIASFYQRQPIEYPMKRTVIYSLQQGNWMRLCKPTMQLL
ncbi:hypothetical protein [Caloramator sp. mosi_1]|uniref:hypothetical protein n=1 Tax=Caloramator sp. mosi_1 TaxID=3023090 RepID=UPI003081BEB1